jgi:hypothetical protein
MQNHWLLAAAILSGGAAVAHLACIVGGPAWYRTFGAGERMVRMVQQGSATPTLVTLCIAAMLAGWSAYALSGAGVLVRLPLLRPVLTAITAAYLLRAAVLPLLFRLMPDRSTAFLIWSSAIVLGFGLVHATGLALGWAQLG